MNEKAKRFFKNPLGIGACCLIGALLTSFGAQLVNTSGYSVKVTSGVADMDSFYAKTYESASVKPFRLSTVGDNKDGMVNAKLAYDLYIPKGVDANHPAPAVALTHGYLNSKEFESGVALELARRGYVVMAYDQYDHGDSTWDTPAQFNFYVWSAYDAMEFLYGQDYVLKAADGTGMIGLSGHSMGGFSSEIAVAWDEFNTMMGVYSKPKVTAMLAQGADFRYVDGYVKGYASAFGKEWVTYNTYKSRTCGALQGDYDEFFFDNSGKSKGTVTEKNYAADKVGYSMLGLTKAGEPNKFYQVDPETNLALTEEQTDLAANYGERIIYKVAGDHPYNTWSPQATSCIIDFFNHGFEHQAKLAGLNDLSTYVTIKDGSKQVWWLKEVFTCIGMLAVMAAVLCGLLGLTNLPFFRLANTDLALIPEVEAPSKPQKAIGIGMTVFSLLLSAFMIPAFMSPGSSSSAANISMMTTMMDVVMYGGIGIALILGIVAIVFKANKKEGGKDLIRPAGGAMLISFVALALRWLLNDGQNYILNSTNRWFNAPSVGTIATWAMASGLLALIFALISHFFLNPNRTAAHLGLKASWKSVGVSLLNAIVISGVVCAFVWAVKGIFNVDFRVYTYAIKTVNGSAFVSALRYLPFFFLFYFCAGISIAVATAGKKGWKADLLAVAIEVVPSALFLLYQYGILIATGTAPFVDCALNGILVQGLIFTLIGLSVYQRRSLQKSGNIWGGVFLNTIFFTFITLANTTIYNLK